MLNPNRLTIKSRLLLILLFITISGVLFIGVLAYRYAQQTIRERILAQLTSVRVARTYEIQSYLDSITKQIMTVSQDDLTARALAAFSQAFDSLETSESISLRESEELELSTFYEETFLPRLEENSLTEPTLETYLPSSLAGRYLQYHYIAANPNPLGEKDKLVSSPEFSIYAPAHQRYHELFRNMPEVFGFYDVFLIDLQGNVVYSVFKEADLGSNLKTGPYRGSGLAQVYEAAIRQPDAGSLVISDFSFYRPSYGAPAAFMAAPVYDGGELLGVLAAQAPIDEINRIMTGGRGWRESGLGETGETYLVAADGLMRSQSRLLIEEPNAYFDALEELELDAATVNLLENTKSPILLQPVDRTVLDAALKGEVGTREALDFKGVQTLSSFAPLGMPGLDWIVVAEMDLAEAFAPLYRFQRLLFLSTAALVLFITVLAMYISSRFVRPIDRFIEGAEAIANGDAEQIEVSSSDEFGRLASSLNGMIRDLNARTEIERKRGDDQTALLASLLPTKVSERLTSGDKQFVEHYPNVSVLFANLRGFGNFSDTQNPKETLARLDELISLFDEAVLKHGVEKVKTLGADYLAVCGAAVSRLDHTRRSLEFAEDMLEQVQFFNQRHGLTLSLSVGLASGAVVAGVVGGSLLVYDVWGKPVDEAMDILAKEAPENSIWLTDSFKDELDDTSGLEPASSSLGNAWAVKVGTEVRA